MHLYLEESNISLDYSLPLKQSFYKKEWWLVIDTKIDEYEISDMSEFMAFKDGKLVCRGKVIDISSNSCWYIRICILSHHWKNKTIIYKWCIKYK